MFRLALLTLALAGCGAADLGRGADGADGAPGADAEAEWTDLLASLDGWHGYARPDVPAAWSLDGGVLTFTPGTDDGGDLVAPGTWADFELEAEWRVAPCGNSGVFYRGEESAALAPIWRTALEMQVLDNCHADGRYPSHRAGALYDLYAPAEDAAVAGGWNASRLVADGDRIEHWLNGARVVSARQGSPGWDARVAVSKFRDGDAFPAYGTRRAGIIGLQDHGDTLRVRAFRIRPL